MTETPSALPIIVDPFSRLAGEIAGDTPSQIALNLAAATRIALYFRCKPIRPCVSPWEAFKSHKAELSPEAVDAVAFTARVYQSFANVSKNREVGKLAHPAVTPHPASLIRLQVRLLPS